jgi:hypothetical protein
MNRSLRTAVSALLLSLCGCAVVRPPEGGPEDKTPPTVAVVDGSYTETDFRRRSIDVEFSEAVERSRVQECVSLSPEKPLSFSWSGRTLTVRFDEDLDTATTYALTIGTQYADLRGNTPTSATTVVFSTGSTLDKGKIAGTVQDEKPNGLLVYLYPLRGDTSQMSWGGTKPRYKTQVGTDGSFRFSALPDGSYRLIVVRDVDNDGVFTYGTDALGTAVADPVIASGSTVACLLRLSPPADITPPELLDIRPRSSTRIDLQWSEPLKPGSVSLSTFILSDTNGANARAIRAVYPQSPGSTTWTCITEAASSDLPLLLRPAHAGVTPQDTAGNRMPDSTAQMVFTPSTIADPLQHGDRPGLCHARPARGMHDGIPSGAATHHQTRGEPSRRVGPRHLAVRHMVRVDHEDTWIAECRRRSRGRHEHPLATPHARHAAFRYPAWRRYRFRELS